MPTHSIGDNEFPLLTGIVQPYMQGIEVIERKGTRDLLRRKTGFQSPMFTLTSFRDVEDFIMAQALIGKYVEALEAEALSLIKDDYQYDTDGLKVVVLGVRPVVEKQRAKIVGGFDSDHHFEVRAAWQLRFVEILPGADEV